MYIYMYIYIYIYIYIHIHIYRYIYIYAAGHLRLQFLLVVCVRERVCTVYKKRVLRVLVSAIHRVSGRRRASSDTVSGGSATA